MITAVVGELLRIHFPVFEEDGLTPSPGLLNTDFTKVLVRDTVSSALPVTVTEVGATGRYFAAFTPDQVGRWYLDVQTPFEDVFGADILVTTAPGTRVVSSFAYNPTTLSLDGNVWLERDGQLDTTAATATVAFYNSAGALLFPPLVDLVPDAQGVFRVTQPSPPGFTQGAEIYVVSTVATPAGSFTTAKGIQVVG
jgi:hypothetical protein